MSVVEVDNRSTEAVDEEALAEQGRFMLEWLRLHPEVELSISVVDSEEMAELNKRWMDGSGPTDVLSFPMDELRVPGPGEQAEPGVLGDVVICPQVAAAQAAQADHGTNRELELLLTHGILHLLGHDHAEPQEHAVMFGLQAELLAAWRSRR